MSLLNKLFKKEDTFLKIEDPIIIGKKPFQNLLEQIKIIETGKWNSYNYNMYDITEVPSYFGKGVSPQGSESGYLPFVGFNEVGSNWVLSWVYRKKNDPLYVQTRSLTTSDLREYLGKRVYDMAEKLGSRLDKKWVLELKVLGRKK